MSRTYALHAPLSTASPSRPLRPGTAVAIAAVALVVRLLYIESIFRAVFFTHLQTEPARYHEWATLILRSTPPRPPFDEPPGYPYFVAAVYALFGAHVVSIAVTQAVLGALSCGLVAAIGGRWFGARVGVSAGLLAAFYGPFIYFTGKVEPPTVFVCVVLLAMWTALPLPTRAAPRWGLAGSLWALATLLRAEVAFAFPLLALDAVRRGGYRAFLRLLAPTALLVILTVAVNAGIGHRPALFTSAPGLILWLGNDVDADGVSPFLSGRREEVAREIGVAAPNSAVADRMFTRRVLHFWCEHPDAAALLFWKKFLWTWNDRELPNTSDIAWETGQSWLFQRPLFPPGLGMVLPFALAGGLLLGRGWREVRLLAAPLAIALGAAVLFFTNARVRLIGAPSLLVLAALVLDRLPGMLGAPRARAGSLAMAVLGLGTGLWLAWGDPYQVRSYRIPQITVNRAILEREAGDADAAARGLRDALASNPEDAIGWAQLGFTEEQRGNDVAALEAYLNGLSRVPADRPVVAYMENVSRGAADQVLVGATARVLRRRGGSLRLLRSFLDAPSAEMRSELRAEIVHSVGSGAPTSGTQTGLRAAPESPRP